MRNTGTIQDAQHWSDSKRHVVAARLQREEFDARLRFLRLLEREARGDRSMMLISSCNALGIFARDQGQHLASDARYPCHRI
ncbi:hypothetical protein [Bradyrhizobium sp. 2S1]|uniref:hypothetical protein n=1 Tax=Bradyrhizobium sp. 2S1 TaxID=1404429 RepID=UPI00140A41AD|nr:hypothetical protein [Bradyrhizobium sp. 2S1]MCK7672901.1 hypothetical protein [Bradyrhizobium sp. 2S1]